MTTSLSPANQTVPVLEKPFTPVQLRALLEKLVGCEITDRRNPSDRISTSTRVPDFGWGHATKAAVCTENLNANVVMGEVRWRQTLHPQETRQVHEVTGRRGPFACHRSASTRQGRREERRRRPRRPPTVTTTQSPKADIGRRRSHVCFEAEADTMSGSSDRVEKSLLWLEAVRKRGPLRIGA